MLKLIWYGTNSVKLIYNNNSILFDPFIRYEKRNDSNFYKNFYDTKNIFITHGHIDHTMDLDMLYSDKNVKIHTTKSPYKRLLKDKFTKSNLVMIKHDDSFNVGSFNVKVLKSKHIKFDLKLIINTLFSKDVIKYHDYLKILIKNNFKCREKNETVLYFISVNKVRIILAGSMALDKKITYPKNVDYLILAYQGRSNLDKKIVNIIKVIKPKNIILTHFDNSFPPISKNVNISNLRNVIPSNIGLIIPKYEKEIVL